MCRAFYVLVSEVLRVGQEVVLIYPLFLSRWRPKLSHLLRYTAFGMHGRLLSASACAAALEFQRRAKVILQHCLSASPSQPSKVKMDRSRTTKVNARNSHTLPSFHSEASPGCVNANRASCITSVLAEMTFAQFSDSMADRWWMRGSLKNAQFAGRTIFLEFVLLSPVTLRFLLCRYCKTAAREQELLYLYSSLSLLLLFHGTGQISSSLGWNKVSHRFQANKACLLIVVYVPVRPEMNLLFKF